MVFTRDPVMATNRRNYYRLLHVQADAPAEVIKAAYRALMAVHHPDVGGNHAVASLLNEAYSVLSDSERRATYDLRRAERPGAKGRAASTPPPKRGCLVCGLALPPVVRVETRCSRCQAPLCAVRRLDDPAIRAERRTMPRVSKSDWGLLHIGWPSEIVDIRMRDLSLDGISVYCGQPLPVGRAVRIVGESLDVVATIVSIRKVAKVHTLHARLVTALFSSPVGGFVSRSA